MHGDVRIELVLNSEFIEIACLDKQPHKFRVQG